MMSSLSFPRSCLTLCSPMTQRIASTMLLLPHPLGPTTAETPGGKAMTALSGKDLNPKISSFFSFIPEKASSWCSASGSHPRISWHQFSISEQGRFVKKKTLWKVWLKGKLNTICSDIILRPCDPSGKIQFSFTGELPKNCLWMGILRAGRNPTNRLTRKVPESYFKGMKTPEIRNKLELYRHGYPSSPSGDFLWKEKGSAMKN